MSDAHDPAPPASASPSADHAALAPDEPQPTDVNVKRRARAAAGLPAVAVTIKRGLTQMGPTRTARTLLRLNQTDGFDCMGCAWPDPAPGERKTAEFCENGAKAVAEEATKARADREFWAAHSVAELATWSDFQLGQSGRLTEPMILREGATHYEPIPWDTAYKLVGETIRDLASVDEAIFYTSGRASNEAAFCYQLFARALGTNNLPDCSNMCHESTSVALAETIGIGKATVTLEDIHDAELLVLCGQNPGTNHPRMLTALEKAKHNGATIVAVNPLPETGLMRFDNPQTPRGLSGVGSALADDFVQIRANGDLALFQALGALLLERDDAARAADLPGPVDRDFIDRHTAGFGAYAAHLRELDWSAVYEATGVSRAEIDRLADRFASSRRTIICWAMGITQHRNAVGTIKEITNLALLQGNIGKPGAGLCPVRGHSNVQGDRTMGIWEKLPPHFANALGEEFGIQAPTKRGHDTVNAVRALRDGKAHVFIGLGGNFAAATPDTQWTHEALRSAKLTVQISTKPNRSHVVHGRTALILPTLGRTERDLGPHGPQGVTVEDTAGSVHLSRGRVEPASPHLRSEVAIITQLAAATLQGGPAGSSIDWEEMAKDYSVVRHHIAHVVPGCEAYDEKVRRPGGFMLPNPPRDNREFDTPSQRALFSVTPLDVMTVPEGHLILQTLRSHDQFNTTIYGHDDRYRGLSGGREVVMVHPADLADLRLRSGDRVDIVAPWQDGSVRVLRGFRAVEYDTARGCAAAYYPETNPLVPLDSTARGSNCPTSKAILVRLVPAGAAPESVRVRGIPLGQDDDHRSPVLPHHLS